ncbi:MAG: hypothetical protein P1V36_08310 [Planctomycetota bacterium]|nr:hypothetical protein [Planctomycetota bacterium]
MRAALHAPSSRPSERGVVLWVTLLMVLLLGGLSTAFLFEGLGEKTAIEHRRTTIRALEICEMGIVCSTMEITALTDATDDGIGNVTGLFAGGDYTSAAHQSATFPDRWKLTSKGTYRLSAKRLEVGIRRRVGGDWVEGLFAKDGVTVNGDVRTDSYDSRLGTYASQATNTDGGGDFANPLGHVGSNTNIRITGSSAHIRGNAIPGPSSVVETAGSPTITGDTLPRRDDIEIPSVDAAEFAAALASNDNTNLSVSGGGGRPPYDDRTRALVATGTKVVTLPGGTYFFSSVRLAGGAVLNVTGPSVIYVTGQFDLGGGSLVNATGIPSNLRVYAHPHVLPDVPAPTHSEVIFNGGAGSALAVYAPEVDITISGNADVYGALVGRAIKSTGDAFFHYDEALGAFNEHGKVHVERLYWKDLSTRLR